MPHYKFTEQTERGLESTTDFTLENRETRQAEIFRDFAKRQ